jgi:hypothetical protein
MASVANINDVLEGHVALEIECVDRLYLNAYLPTMQVGGQVVRFLRGHLGYEIPSPALLAKIGNRFRREVSAFARERDIPVLRLAKPDRSRWDDRKLDQVRRYLGPSRARGPLRSRRDRHVPGIPVGLFRPRPSGTREGGQLSVLQGESPRWDLLLLHPGS